MVHWTSIVICIAEISCPLDIKDVQVKLSIGHTLYKPVLFGSLHGYHVSLDHICNTRGNLLLDFMAENSFMLVNGRTISNTPA